MSKQFYFKQFSLAWLRSLHVKTILFQAVQFSFSLQFKYQDSFLQVIQFTISTQFSSISPIGFYQVVLLQARVDLGVMAIKSCSASPKP